MDMRDWHAFNQRNDEMNQLDIRWMGTELGQDGWWWGWGSTNWFWFGVGSQYIRGVPNIQSVTDVSIVSCAETWCCLVRHRFWADTVETSQYYPILMQQKPLFGMIGHALVQREFRGSTGTTVGIPFIEEPFALTSGKAQNPVSHVVRSGQTCRMFVVCGSFMYSF